MTDFEEIKLKNLDKAYYGDILKADIIEYYIKAAPLILPHIVSKPFSMIHFPDGVYGKSFYQKQCPIGAPSWLETVAIKSSSRGHIDWCLVNDRRAIIYMASRSVIEMHTWFSRLPNLELSDIAVIDLDPGSDISFFEVLVLARAFGIILKQLGVFAVPKTSGGSGMHIYIPIKPSPFTKVQKFLGGLCSIIISAHPNIATTERSIDKRGAKVYLDAVQNAYGKTIIAPYSLRARPHIPVSTPLLWNELDNDSLTPRDFTVKNIFSRLKKVGDLFKNFYSMAQDLPEL